MADLLQGRYAPARVGRHRLSLFPGALPVSCLLLVLGLWGPNFALAALAILVLLVGGSILWRPGEPPILFFLFLVHCLQASLRPFQANLLGASVDELAPFPSHVALATLLSLTATLLLAAGMRLGAGRWQRIDGDLARFSAVRYDPKVWFRIYLIASVVAFAARWLAPNVPGLTQPLLAVANLKWAFFWILMFATFANPRASRRYGVIAFAFEFAIGIGGYFSSFKSVIFVSALAVVAAHFRLSRRGWIAVAVSVAGLVAVSLVWTAIKSDYRHFVSGGVRAQIVTVDYTERVGKLWELTANLTPEDLGEAINNLVDRVGYVEFFGATLMNVPSIRPHESGALWWDAVTRPLMPRLLFPHKTNISDSERTNIYSGVRVAGDDEGVSIGIGYMAESYIDFGPFGMMIPIAVLGYLIGKAYRWLVTSDRSFGLLGMGLATSLLVDALYLETSITKLFGGLVVAFLASALLLKFLAPRFLGWMRTPVLFPPR